MVYVLIAISFFIAIMYAVRKSRRVRERFFGRMPPDAHEQSIFMFMMAFASLLWPFSIIILFVCFVFEYVRKLTFQDLEK